VDFIEQIIELQNTLIERQVILMDLCEKYFHEKNIFPLDEENLEEKFSKTARKKQVPFTNQDYTINVKSIFIEIIDALANVKDLIYARVLALINENKNCIIASTLSSCVIKKIEDIENDLKNVIKKIYDHPISKNKDG
jgi:hypothetical protein